jgi:hypothetical protein
LYYTAVLYEVKHNKLEGLIVYCLYTKVLALLTKSGVSASAPTYYARCKYCERLRLSR